MEEDNRAIDPERERWQHSMYLAVIAFDFGVGLLFGWLLEDAQGGMIFVGGQALVPLSLCCIGILFFFVPSNQQ